MKIKCETIKGDFIEVDKTELSLRVKACAVINDKRMLLVNPAWDGYSLPGGGVEVGETPEGALARETLDETGYSIIDLKIFHVSNTYFILPDSLKPVQTITLYYHCRIKGGIRKAIKLDTHEKTYMSEAKWISIDKILVSKIYNPISIDVVLTKAGLL